jgi:hypothetical protein
MPRPPGSSALALVLALAAAAALSHALTRYWLEQPALGPNVRRERLRSQVLGEEREVLVHLPAGYQQDTAKRYPVLCVLDGSSQDVHTAASAALLARIGRAPEMLVVGVPNVSGSGRQRDYTPPGMRQDIDEADSPEGRGDRFLAFLKTELLPKLDREYRSDGTRMLAGHSRGGLLVLYSLIAEPDLFDARFAHSPALWRDDAALIGRLEAFLAGAPSPRGFLYLSLGDEENDKMRAAFKRAVALLEQRAPATLRWRADTTRGAGHLSNPEYATPVGLDAYFAGAPATRP